MTYGKPWNRNLARRAPLPQQPRNIKAVEAARAAGRLSDGDPVVVSFVGDLDTGYKAIHVYADSGKAYDWSGIMGLRAIVVVKPGVDCADAVRRLMLQWTLEPLRHGNDYPTLVDLERRDVAAIVTGPKLWPMPKDTDLWRQHIG